MKQIQHYLFMYLFHNVRSIYEADTEPQNQFINKSTYVSLCMISPCVFFLEIITILSLWLLLPLYIFFKDMVLAQVFPLNLNVVFKLEKDHTVCSILGLNIMGPAFKMFKIY